MVLLSGYLLQAPKDYYISRLLQHECSMQLSTFLCVFSPFNKTPIGTLHYIVQGKFTAFKNRPPSQAFLRAIGPKDVHAERTCIFLPPKEYEAMKVAKRASRNWKSSQEVSRNLQNQELATKTVQKRSSIVIKSLDFDTKQIGDQSKELTRSHSYSGSTAVYHSLADSFREHGSSQPTCRQKPVGVPVFPMNVLDSNNLPTPVMS